MTHLEYLLNRDVWADTVRRLLQTFLDFVAVLYPSMKRVWERFGTFCWCGTLCGLLFFFFICYCEIFHPDICFSVLLGRGGRKGILFGPGSVIYPNFSCACSSFFFNTAPIPDVLPPPPPCRLLFVLSWPLKSTQSLFRSKSASVITVDQPPFVSPQVHEVLSILRFFAKVHAVLLILLFFAKYFFSFDFDA